MSRIDNPIALTSAPARGLREWLNGYHRLYVVHPVTDSQLCVWLSQAEESPDGLVEISARHSVTGAPVTYSLEK